VKLGVVTTFPPGKGTLNEYGYHFVRHLEAKPEVTDLALFVDELPAGETYPVRERSRAIVSWKHGSIGNAVRIWRAVRREKPDAVIFNIQFTSFGSGKIAAALGLMTPALLHATGTTTIVLLHNLMDTVDLKGAGFRMSGPAEWLTRTVGRFITKSILRADLVAVTIPTYVELLRDRYGATNVVLAPHGTFDDVPDLPRDPAGRRTIMAFGKFGTYKKIESLVAAYRLLRAEDARTELVIAGTDSPNAAGYLAGIAEANADLPGLTFTGYVAEEDVPGIFLGSDVVVFPYTSTTGSSGVLHQAGEHGRAVALPDIGDLAELIREEGYSAVTFQPDDPADLARAIRGLLDDDDARHAMGAANLAAARGLPMADIVDWYLIHLDEIAADRTARGRRNAAWT
jgi:glycosyltransferase involved in cell wall biosynthesis